MQNGISKHLQPMMIESKVIVQRELISNRGKTVVEETRTPVYEQYQFNERNKGFGLQLEKQNHAKIRNYYVGYYLDSNAEDAYYFGSGRAHRFKPFNLINIDTGALFIGLSRKRVKNGLPFPAVLPYISMGWNRLALNASFIPGVGDITVPTLFFQAKIQIK
ncbi:MAG: hypothetical protein OEY38_18015 [Gammaproteobacteria bacterium]|nr:hypothetical protein [Gammaproteobacteria bacterium]